MSLRICGSEGDEKQKTSLSIMSRLEISVRLGIMLRMRLWRMGCFVEEFRILQNWCSPVQQEEGNSSRSKNFCASRVYRVPVRLY